MLHTANLENQFFLLSFPEIVNNDVNNDVDASADDEEKEPEINNLKNVPDTVLNSKATAVAEFLLRNSSLSCISTNLDNVYLVLI